MTTEYIAPNTNTAEWDSYPFSVDGVQFVSKILKASDIAERLLTVPAFIFENMNINCIREVVGNVATMSRADILKKLEEVNHGGQNAIVELA